MKSPISYKSGITLRSNKHSFWTFIYCIFMAAYYCHADPPTISGGGNFTNGKLDPKVLSQYKALNDAHAGAIRINIYPKGYYDAQKACPEKLEAEVLEAHKQGVKTIVLEFEFYGDYQLKEFGGRDKWYAIGHDFAAHFGPDSDWLKAQGISGWGITIYEAFNEPDHLASLPIPDYVANLKGLADGVHSVNPSLAVIPAGFMAANAWRNYTLRGYGTGIAPLLNDGTLDGIDLHTYNDISYSPIIDKNGKSTFSCSPQSDFDNIKNACGITRDINFYSTEYNFKRSDKQGIDEKLSAKRFLTCIWATLGVQKSDKTPATKLALAWNLFSLIQSDKTYGLNTNLDPWTPTASGRTFQMVMALTQQMNFTSVDPKGMGEFVLEGAGKKMWVWQDYPGWTTCPGTSFTLENIPTNSTHVEVYGWDGLRRTIPVNGEQSLKVDSLDENETFMFLAKP